MPRTVTREQVVSFTRQEFETSYRLHLKGVIDKMEMISLTCSTKAILTRLLEIPQNEVDTMVEHWERYATEDVSKTKELFDQIV